MNLISHVAIVVVPRWVRVLVVVILATLSIIYLGLSVLGIYDSTRPGWIEAGTYILGILLPFVLIGLILLGIMVAAHMGGVPAGLSRIQGRRPEPTKDVYSVRNSFQVLSAYAVTNPAQMVHCESGRD